MTTAEARTAPLPVNARIVVVSIGTRDDGSADELARRLHRQGWWVDRPDALGVPPVRLGPALLSLSGTGRAPRRRASVPACVHPLGSRVAGAVLDRLTARTAALIGDVPHAVVSTHPLVSQLLGRLRRSGALDAPVISYVTDPAVHPLWWHPGVDLVLSPEPGITDQVRRLARTTPGARTGIVETARAQDPAEVIHRAALTPTCRTPGTGVRRGR
ncbi:hypothetical protein LQ327_20605 [Actinomycetospora endophytica]|uniref:Diacylglycerol glucosyltransferase N-terminal domain-containing protein n=1 Tax=Actinomycetospora endophytica TaxID=2291215 RepID=A0ABS8PC02_9PSEU|nr:hypothetical protein [Actinomycetospora endophytica]MCD2195777.1 hypothetical protein [Actinomycetospora endophytica]